MSKIRQTVESAESVIVVDSLHIFLASAKIDDT